MKRVKKLNSKGFTLIELMVAILLFFFATLGVAQMQLSSIRYNSQARHISEATVIAQDKMEELLALDYTDSGLDETDGNESDDDIDDNYDVFKNIAANTPDTGTKFIQVIVNWVDNGANKSVTLETIKAQL